jgi:DNA helicase-2/ATP-dependent DNA helicase PcrA
MLYTRAFPAFGGTRVPDRIVTEELDLLRKVNDALERVGEPVAPSEENLVDDLEHIREQLLHGEMDFFERSSLNTRFNVQMSLLDQLRKSRETPRVDRGSPYFAHLRLDEGGRTRDVCLGKATRLDNGLRIVDWRNAPIAQLFYRYQQGDEFEEDISGRVQEGTVVARRTVTIRQGNLERVESPEGVFVPDAAAEDGWRRSARSAPKLGGGEGAALRVHSEALSDRRLGTDAFGREQRPDKRLPDIAGLIDPEQFALITRPNAGYVVIRGAAGSGKTTVALHRIAFLAYEDPLIDSPDTLFVVFSPGLRDYVSHVLPALGVGGVRVCTYQEWAAGQRQRLLGALPDRQREDTTALTQRLKLHPSLLTALERQIARTPGKPSWRQVIDDWISVLTDAELLADVFEQEAPDSLNRKQLTDIARSCRSDMEAVQAHLEGDKEAGAELDPEDDAILLRAWQLRIGPLPGPGGEPLRYRHVAIDEVQDFSPLEVRVLMDCLDTHRSLTLAGDTQQHVMAESGFTSWSAFFQHLGIAGTEIDTLQVSYRSSDEIARFAVSVLGELREDDAPLITTRSGPPVELFHYTDHGACIISLADALVNLASDEPMASVAVLTPTPALSDIYYEGLNRSDVPRLHQVTRQDFRFAPGIEVTEIAQVKGLEFDYVILVGVNAEHFDTSAKARRLLHVGATRAVHQLWIATTGAESPLLKEAAQTLS